MSKFVVNFGKKPEEQEPVVWQEEGAPQHDAPFLNQSSYSSTQPPQRGKAKRFLAIAGISLLAVLFVGFIAGLLYWQSLKDSPQYSLALLVDAARRDDQQAIDELVDTDAVIEDFMPQVSAKAIELYGRNLPQSVIDRVEIQAQPLMPAIKQRARAEVPALIREKTKPFESFPFWAIAIGAPQYMDITEEGEKAFVKSKIPDRPLELTMKKNGDKWKVVALKDDVLARRIAEKIGQEMIAAAKEGSLEKTLKKKNSQAFEDLKNTIQDIFK